MPIRNLRHQSLTDVELERLSSVSATDEQAARAAWKKDAPAPFRNLLDAKVPEEDEEDEDAT